jgi:hypothetical protein
MYLAIFTGVRRAQTIDGIDLYIGSSKMIGEIIDTEEKLEKIKNKENPYQLSDDVMITYDDVYLSEAFHKVE